jgi:hypothetical protein
MKGYVPCHYLNRQRNSCPSLAKVATADIDCNFSFAPPFRLEDRRKKHIKLITWNKVALEKLTVAHFVKKFYASYRTLTLIIVSLWARWIHKHYCISYCVSSNITFLKAAMKLILTSPPEWQHFVPHTWRWKQMQFPKLCFWKQILKVTTVFIVKMPASETRRLLHAPPILANCLRKQIQNGPLWKHAGTASLTGSSNWGPCKLNLDAWRLFTGHVCASRSIYIHIIMGYLMTL